MNWAVSGIGTPSGQLTRLSLPTGMCPKWTLLAGEQRPGGAVCLTVTPGTSLPVNRVGVAQHGGQRRDSVTRLVERLATLSRVSASPGERCAAQLVAEALRSRGARVRTERERVHGTYWVPIGLACAGTALASRRSRGWGLLVGMLGALIISDDLEIGRRPLRRMLRQRTTVNVIGEFGPETPMSTLVVHAHHDAARTGLVFHPAVAKLAARFAGGAIERMGGTPPPMLGAVAGPALVALGAALGTRRVARLGEAFCACYAAAMLDIARRPPVPGANDNLSGVAVLLAIADALGRQPPRRLRVVLLSTGSEESFLEAMVRFGERHFPGLSRETTTFLCIESVGSPHLMLLSGEGLLRLHRYPADLIDLLTCLADGIALHDPFRYRLATDGQIPLRAGYPTAVISSMDWYKAPSNYHWPTDRPENLDAQSIADAATMAIRLVRRLDAVGS